MKQQPPRWADRFLMWYCNPRLLEEIQGDAYELFYRSAKENKYKADFYFIWNVLRFFRWKNIRRSKQKNTHSLLSTAMLKNFYIVTLRNFKRQPVHSALNLFGLSIGFLCAFLILLWVSHEFSFDRFHKESDSIYKVLAHAKVEGVYETYNVASASLDVSSIPEIESKVMVIEGERWPNELCFRKDGNNNECVFLKGIYAGESFFSLFTFPILEGDNDPLKAPNHIAISENMAEQLFGFEDAVGKIIKIDGRIEVTVASVYANPPGNTTLQFDFVMPFAIIKNLWGISDGQFDTYAFSTYIKTHSASSPELLTKKLNDPLVLSEEFRKQNIHYEAYPLTAWRLQDKFENGKVAGGRIEYIYIFIAIGSMVLLMAVINFINMSTARATSRAKEIGIRKATGAFRSSIITQFLSESFIIVFAAFIIALLLTQLSLPYFNLLLTEPISRQWYEGEIVFYIIAGLIMVALAAGLYPAFVMSSFQPVKILKNQMNAQGTGSERLRKSLLVVQLSISIAIIIFTGVMYQQMSYITHKDMGFERSNTLRIEPTFQLLKKFDAFKNELQKNASIIGAAAANDNPLDGQPNINVSWPGKAENTRIAFQAIGCSYEFASTIGLRFKEGRDFLPKAQDTLYNEAIISEDAIKTMGLKQALGEHIEVNGYDCVIIGVVQNFHTSSLQKARLPVVLYREKYTQCSALYVRYQPGTTQQSLTAINDAYKKLEPSYTMKYWFQDDSFNELYRTEITASRLILLFTIISVIIAIIGVVGLSTFNVMRKTKEMSIRRVFGASMVQVLTLLSNEFSGVMLIAMGLAFPAAWYVADQWLSKFMYHTDLPWWIFIASLGGMAMITLLIILTQGVKTLSANPTKVLRND